MTRQLASLLLLLLSALPMAAADVVFAPILNQDERFKDIGGTEFNAAYISGYSYTNASVNLSLTQSGLKYLDGVVTATGLKPNFCYQLKLVGRPSKAATTSEQALLADDATNERLGLTGRWWRMQPNPSNTNDTEYSQFKDDPAYIFQGYLEVGFFVTDASGNASVRIVGNNSYHVVWRVDQRPRSTNDGPILNHVVPATTANPAYDASLGPRAYALYGEWEPNRALPGQMAMPDGAYNCDVVLTEESFHDFGPLAGNWSAVLTAPLQFSIPTQFGDGPPVDPPSTKELSVEQIRLLVSPDNTGRDSGRADFTLALPSSVTTLNGLQLAVTVQGVTRSFTLSKSGRANDRTGRCAAKLIDETTNTARIRVDIPRTDFVFAAEPLPALIVLTVNTTINGEVYTGQAVTPVRGKNRKTLSFKK